MKYQILLYRQQTRHRLVKRFNSYRKLAEWCDKNINKTEIHFYHLKQTKNIVKQ